MPSGTLPYPGPLSEQQFLTPNTRTYRVCRNLLSHKIVMPAMEQTNNSKSTTTTPIPATTIKNYHFLMDQHQQHVEENHHDDYAQQPQRQRLEAEQFQRANAIRNHQASRAAAKRLVHNTTAASGHTPRGSYSTATSASAAAAESADESPSSLVRSDLDYDKHIVAHNRNKSKSGGGGAASYDVVPSTLSHNKYNINRHRNSGNHQPPSQKTASSSTTTTNIVDRSPVISVDDASTSRGYYSDAAPTVGDDGKPRQQRISQQQQEDFNQRQHQQVASAARPRRTNDEQYYYVSTTGQQPVATRPSGVRANMPDNAARHAQNNAQQPPPQQHYYYTTPTPATPVVVSNSNHHAQQQQRQQHQLSHYYLPPQYYQPQPTTAYRPVYATLPSRLPSGSPTNRQWITDGGFIGSNGPLTAAPSYMTLVQLVPTNAVGRPMDIDQPPMGRNGKPMTVRELKKLRNKQKKGGKDLYSAASFRSDWPLPTAAVADTSSYFLYDYNNHQQSTPWAYATMPRADAAVLAQAAHQHHEAAMAAAAAAAAAGGVPAYRAEGGGTKSIHPPPPHIVKPARLDSSPFNPNMRQFHHQNGIFVPNHVVSKTVDFRLQRPSFCRRICCTGYALVAWLIALVVLIGITVTIMLLVLFR